MTTTPTVALSFCEYAVIDAMRIVRQTGRPGCIVLFVETDGGVTIRTCEPPRRVRAREDGNGGIDTPVT